MVVTFSRSAAPVTLIGKPVTAGITLTPAMEGEWQWRNDRKLVFTAKKTFPMGKTYTVDMDAKTLLAPQVALTEKQKTFTTPEFYYRGGRAGYRKYKPPFCSSSEVSYLKFPHSFTAQAPILTAGPA